MLKIESIQNGIVIDHIPAGKGMDIYKLLELDSQKQSIALLQSVRSEKYGCKDLIRKSCTPPMENTQMPCSPCFAPFWLSIRR